MSDKHHVIDQLHEISHTLALLRLCGAAGPPSFCMGVLYEVFCGRNRVTSDSPPLEFQQEKNGGVASRLLNSHLYSPSV